MNKKKAKKTKKTFFVLFDNGKEETCKNAKAVEKLILEKFNDGVMVSSIFLVDEKGNETAFECKWAVKIAKI